MAYIWASEALPKYDGRSTLKNFLYQVLYRKFCNLKRAQYERRATPCETCPLSAYNKSKDLCEAYAERDDCHYWRSWILRNERKKALNISLEANPQPCNDNNFELVDCQDTIEFLRSKIIDVRGLNIILEGGNLSSERMATLQCQIKKALNMDD